MSGIIIIIFFFLALVQLYKK
eukprot:COSAG05_NODE_13653_length_422_cov_0.671827_2_plen_20_part_01